MSPNDADPEKPPLTLSSEPESDSATVESVMAEYLESIEAGQAPNPADYLAKFPQHATELQSFFQNHHWLADEPASPTPSLIGHRIGAYTIEAEIARGGMGTVYRARQTGLSRTVALKLISNGILAGAEERKRFRNEAEAAARLQHPGIVPIHETGTWNGYEYFSMTFIEGPTLQSWVRAKNESGENESLLRRPEFHQVAEAVRDIARAVGYAHRNAIVHRDLKPENILLDAWPDGRPRPMVTDFGLAKWHREGTVVTRTGQVLGTPNYMSPEQAAGFSDGDARVDVYALGAILYALLTGRPPHEGPSLAETLRCVLQDEPPSIRQLSSKVPIELESICGKAMRFTPNERYPSADAMADDLDRFLSGDPIEAHHSGLVDAMTREFRRDQFGVSFQSWGRTLRQIGWIILIAHLFMFGLALADLPVWITFWTPRFLMLLSIGWLIRWSRGGNLLPRSAAERPIWSIWLGYLAALMTMNALLMLGGLEQVALFPVAAALSGFGFIAMAGHIWGGSAVMGLGFLVIAPFTFLMPTTAALWFGISWWLALHALGHHYRGETASTAS
ncbi:MAG: serine/threonine-protein kinase [Planctomycetota bacterium]